jgi:Tfp pilus assembly major pilin PilA
MFTAEFLDKETIGIIATILVLAVQQYLNKQNVVAKINENTAVNVEALSVANGHNEKIAKVTEIATETAAASLETIMDALRQNAKELALLKAATDETRRLVEMRVPGTPPAA